ncbi:hypothetical protein VHN57_05465 [Sphingobium sp. WW5]|uniref:hypothetical protein n=1 Tax=unclassified Sphingobium TaxID=2611147 RepID=UPI003C1318D8
MDMKLARERLDEFDNIAAQAREIGGPIGALIERMAMVIAAEIEANDPESLIM